MRQILVRLERVLLLTMLFSAIAYSQAGAKILSLKDITSGVFVPKSAGQGFRSTEDGKAYTILADGGRAVVKYSYETGMPIDTLFSLAKATGADFEEISDYLLSRDGHHMVLLRAPKAIYRRSRSYLAYHYDVRRHKVEPLSPTSARVRIPLLSPNGRMCAYVIDNDIYIKKFDYDTEVRITTDGKVNSVLNGVTDWVYEEELYATSLMAWNTESDYLAYVRSDESQVKVYQMMLYGDGNYPTPYQYKYPKAGEKNSEISLHQYNVDTRETVTLPLPVNGEYYIPRLEYHQGQLYTFTLSRGQDIFRIYRTHPKSRVTALWMEDRDERYIDSEWIRQFVFSSAGAYYVSESSGRPQIYRVSSNGSREEALSESSEEVIKLYGATSDGSVVYSIASPTPMDRTLLKRDGKGRVRTLSCGKGVFSAVFSRDLSYYLLGESAISSVPVYTIRRTSDAKVLATLEDNAALQTKLGEYRIPQKEMIEIKTSTGQTLNAWVMKPTGFDPTRKYPLVMTQYSGPNSQSVLNEYGLGWEYALAESGFVVACVDPRGTGARGSEFKKCTYLKMGILERNDQVAAAQYLGTLPYIDATHIGIFGWSFGGYMTLMCMSEGSGTFAAGVAVAPPTDWRLYDTIYTERYMRTPQQNPKGYSETSVITHAEKLQGRLLIVQGSADDNVHMQNVMMLTPHLNKADKDYDMMIYTDKNHSIYGGNTRYHLYSKIIRHFSDALHPVR